MKRPIFKADKSGKMKKMVPEDEIVRENRKKVVINRETAGNLDATEMIQNFDDLYRNYHDCPDPEMVEASQSILKNPRATEFDKEIEDLPKPYVMYYPVSSLILLSYCADWKKTPIKPWRSHGTRKKQEIKLDKSTFIIYEIKRLGLFENYKEHWTRMEEYYDDWNIPHEYRSTFRKHELNYLSLMIHDIEPSAYLKNLSPIDTEPQRKNI